MMSGLTNKWDSFCCNPLNMDHTSSQHNTTCPNTSEHKQMNGEPQNKQTKIPWRKFHSSVMCCEWCWLTAPAFLVCPNLRLTFVQERVHKIVTFSCNLVLLGWFSRKGGDCCVNKFVPWMKRPYISVVLNSLVSLLLFSNCSHAKSRLVDPSAK